MCLLKEGFRKFTAVERDNNDSAQDCQAELTVAGAVYHGSTGKQHGHAEMDALDKFLNELYEQEIYPTLDDLVEKNKLDMKTAKDEGYVATQAVKLFKTYQRTMVCDNKSCCVKCSAILGHLGISPGANTYKTKQIMGKATQYGVSHRVKVFIAAYLKTDVGTVELELLNSKGL
jgi:hypothetical protein